MSKICLTLHYNNRNHDCNIFLNRLCCYNNSQSKSKTMLKELNQARKEMPRQFWGGIVTLASLFTLFYFALNIFG